MTPGADGLVHLMGDDLLDACHTAGVGTLVVAPISVAEHVTCPACRKLAGPIIVWTPWTPTTERPLRDAKGRLNFGLNPVTNRPADSTPIRAKVGATTIEGVVRGSGSDYPLLPVTIPNPEHPDEDWLATEVTLWLKTGWTFEIGEIQQEPDVGPAEPDILDLPDEDPPGMWSQSDFTGGEGAVWSEKHGRYI